MPLIIQLPAPETQAALNARRWRELLTDPLLATLPHRIETDRHGRIVMSPPPAFAHGRRQARIAGLLLTLMPEGQTVTECPLSTSDGVKAIDVAWLAPRREENTREPVLLERAPEVCIEILSPSNTPAEMAEKRALYFEAGAREAWNCGLDGNLEFYVAGDEATERSGVCPDFPNRIV